jgi:uncharacterized protein
MLIDCHVHINNYDEARSRSADAIAADLFAAMDENDVDHAVVLTSYKVNAHRPHVDEVIRVLGGDPRITIVEGLRWRDPDEQRTDLFPGGADPRRAGEGHQALPRLRPVRDQRPVAGERVSHRRETRRAGDDPHRRHLLKHAKVRQAHPLLVDDVAVDYPDVKLRDLPPRQPVVPGRGRGAVQERQRLRRHLRA